MTRDPGNASSGGPERIGGIGESRLVAAAVTILAGTIVLGAVVATFWALARFIGAFSHVIMPLGVGGLAALVLRPWFKTFREWLGLPKWAALIAVYLSVAAIFGVFALVFGQIIAAQLDRLLASAPETVQRLSAWVSAEIPAVLDFFENNEIGQQIREFVVGQQATILQGMASAFEQAAAAGAGVVRGVGHLLSWALCPLYFGFFLIWKAPHVDRARTLPFLSARTRDTAFDLAHDFATTLVVFFRAQLLVAFLQGLLIAIGLTAIGLDYGFILGMFLGFLTIIPYLGTTVGFLMAVPLAWTQPDGGLVLAALVASVLIAVQLIEGWLLTPRIMGDRTGLHWMAVIVAVLFWGTALGGLTGAVLGIPLTAFLVSAWRMLRDRYFPVPA